MTWRSMAACFLAALGILARGAEISGTVRDPSGGSIPGAAVSLTSRTLAAPSVTVTGPAGDFRLNAVEPGQYRLTVAADGFSEFTRNITVRERAVPPMSIVLRIRDLRQELTVTDRTESLGIESAVNQDSPQASGTQLADLPALDGDYLAPLTRFIDPAAVGAGGLSVVVDGHEGPTSRVPRSMVKEVRVNNNPYAAQFSAPGRGRIEVITKDPDPGFHGNATVIYRDYHLNARDPLATSRPEEKWRTYQATLTGHFGRGKRDFWMLSGERVEKDTVGVVYALTPSGLVQENVPAPTHRNWGTARWNHRHGKDGSFWLGYEHDSSVARSQNVGGTRLPEAGTDNGWFWNEIRKRSGPVRVLCAS